MHVFNQKTGEDLMPEAYKTIVVGLGVTGISVAGYLQRAGIPFCVIDSRDTPPSLETFKKEFVQIDVFCGALNESMLKAATTIIVSPGVAVAEQAIQSAMRAGCDIIGDVELFARNVKSPVIAITGSNGKSTVTMLLGEMAKAQSIDVSVGGNIGVPVLDLIKEQEADLYVLELSSFQLETTKSLNAVSATVLNISQDHMDRYQSTSDYIKAKQRIYHGNGSMIINADDNVVMSMMDSHRDVCCFSYSSPDEGNFGIRKISGEDWIAFGDQDLMPVSKLTIKGQHNTMNALAALALGYKAGLDILTMCKTLESFSGLKHRCQWLGERNHVSWYNDSKGTNVGATVAAIEGIQCQGKLILIAGGISKDADFKPLSEALMSRRSSVILIGRDACKIKDVIAGEVPLLHVNSMLDAVKASNNIAIEGDVVLLSPACASFDMFENYQHRGDVFIQAVSEVVGL